MYVDCLTKNLKNSLQLLKPKKGETIMQDICFDNPCSCFYVDSENVPNWEPLLEGKVRFNDNIFVFSSVNATKVLEENLDKFRKEGALCTVVNCYTGKNAMDFQLVSLMGYMINEFPKSHHTIISADTGYKPVKDFWETAGVDIEIIGETAVQESRLKLRQKSKKSRKKAEKEDLEKIIQKTIKNLGKTHKSRFLSDLHNELIHAYGVDRGRELYMQIKDSEMVEKYKNFF